MPLARPPVGSPVNTVVSVPNTVTILATANPARNFIEVQNTGTSNDLWIAFGSVTPAVGTGIKILPGQFWRSPPNYTPVSQLRGILSAAGPNVVSVIQG